MPTPVEILSGIPESYPLLDPSRVDLPLIASDRRYVSGRHFLGSVACLAATLPEGRYAINLCTTRSRFLLGFAAALSRGQTTLLPPNRTDVALSKILRDYPDSYVLFDEQSTPSLSPAESVLVPCVESSIGIAPNPSIPARQLAAIVFTSGSTAESQAIPKTWGLFCQSVDLIAAHLGLLGAPLHHVLATVPAQHMYGLETTILLPLRTAHVATDDHAFYPSDLQHALDALPSFRMLVTTPLHLRACLEDGGAMPPVDVIISATAPLSQTLAKGAEALFRGTLIEIFGFSEAGSIAVRRTARHERWELFRGLELVRQDGGYGLNAPYLPQPVPIQDRIEVLDRQHFRLLGRLADQVNIAGKRTSIAALTAAINEIEGIRDGVFFVPESADPNAGISRLTAFVVAPGLTDTQVLAELRRRIDAAFLPRPLYLVDALPRRDNGKLARADLILLARACAQRKPNPDDSRAAHTKC